MIKVLGLALYGPLAASTRYRLGQYVNGLESYGINLQIRHLLGDDYLRIRFSGGSLPFKILIRHLISRIKDLSTQNNYNSAILHCELIPLMPGILERGLIRKPYIYDFDDAFYLKYQRGWLGIASPLLKNKFDTIIAGAGAVTAGNKVLANYANLHNQNTIFFPTVVNTQRYIPQLKNRGDKVFTIGWIGSPSTAIYLREIVAPLSIIGQEGAVTFVVIGGKAPYIPNVTVMELEWSEETELELINSFDVGVMPLTDDEWSRGKCAFKLIQYMSCAVPVVASPVGANIDVVGGSSGLLASTSQDWVDALRILRDQPNLRKEMGQAGRDRVLSSYSLHKNLPVLANLIYNLEKKTSV
jgi:glycosyltransferase involved in cell wall biosynthesis